MNRSSTAKPPLAQLLLVAIHENRVVALKEPSKLSAKFEHSEGCGQPWPSPILKWNKLPAQRIAFAVPTIEGKLTHMAIHSLDFAGLDSPRDKEESPEGNSCPATQKAEKLPETTPNATFLLAANVVVRRRKRTISQKSQRQPRRVTNAISTARRFRDYLDRPDTNGYRQVADHFDITRATVSHYLSLLRFLPSDFVEWLGACDDPAVLGQFNERRLRPLLHLPKTSQLEAMKSIADGLSKYFGDDHSVISDLYSVLGQTP